MRDAPGRRLTATLLLVLVLLVAGAPRAGARERYDAPFFDRTGKLARIPFRTLDSFENRLAAVVAGANAEAFWRDVKTTGQMPLVFGKEAVFLYRGTATTVDWVGDFTLWRSDRALTGQRAGKTDIWIARRSFPADARLDYKIRVDGLESKDPLNPLTQPGGHGLTSVLRMPEYVYPEITIARSNGPKGTLSKPIAIDSESLGYAKRFQVYTPPGYSYKTARNLSVLYVTDGHEYANPSMGALPVVLDNLIADGKIEPVLAVFIDPRSVSTGENLRGPELLTNPRFQAFLTKELIPWIDRHYSTRPLAASRAILGMSLGGLHATYTAMRQPDTFGLIGILSPYYIAKPGVLAEVEKSKRQPVKWFVSQGTFDYDVQNTRKLRAMLSDKGYEFKYVETNDGHSWGNWRGMLDDLLLYFWGDS